MISSHFCIDFGILYNSIFSFDVCIYAVRFNIMINVLIKNKHHGKGKRTLYAEKQTWSKIEVLFYGINRRDLYIDMLHIYPTPFRMLLNYRLITIQILRYVYLQHRDYFERFPPPLAPIPRERSYSQGSENIQIEPPEPAPIKKNKKVY